MSKGIEKLKEEYQKIRKFGKLAEIGVQLIQLIKIFSLERMYARPKK